eukprot:Rmarinus@m.25444
MTTHTGRAHPRTGLTRTWADLADQSTTPTLEGGCTREAPLCWGPWGRSMATRPVLLHPQAPTRSTATTTDHPRCHMATEAGGADGVAAVEEGGAGGAVEGAKAAEE